MLRILATVAMACLAQPTLATGIAVLDLPDLVPAGVAAEPSVAVDRDGGFVLTWQSRLADGATALDFARVDADGGLAGSGRIASGSGWFVNWADFPALVVLDNGDWLAHWLERSGPGRYAYDIRVRRSHDAGRSWMPAQTLHDDDTRSEHGFVAWAAIGGDAAHAIWLDGRHTEAAAGSAAGDHADHAGHGHQASGAMSLRAALIGRAGIGEAAQLDDRVCDCCQTDAVRVGGQTLVVYRDRSVAEIRDVQLVRHDGRRWRAPEPLFADGWRVPGCPVNGPAIAARGDLVLAVAYSEAGGTAALRYRSSTTAGRTWRPAVALVTSDSLGRVDAAALSGGRFLIAHQVEVGRQAQLRLDLVDADDRLAASRILATAQRAHLPGFPRMAASGDTVLLAWTEVRQGQPRLRVARVRADPTAP